MCSAIKRTVKIFLCMVWILWTDPSYVYSEGYQGITVGVIPFSPSSDIDEDDMEDWANAISLFLAGSFRVYDYGRIADALENVDCDDEEEWNDDLCIGLTGHKVGADFIVSGSAGKIGNLVIIDVRLHDIKKHAQVWSREYQLQLTALESDDSPLRKIADDLSATLLTVAPAVPPAMEQDSSGVHDSAPITSVGLLRTDVGIVNAPTLGISGIFSLGRVGRTQSLAGVNALFLYPTTATSHIRCKLGVPIFHNTHNPQTRSKKLSDPYATVEHEWGWRKLGVTAGLGYMFLQRYSRVHEGMWGDRTYKYNNHNTFNVIAGIRAGKPCGGFYGRLSFPMAITLEQSLINRVLEYSLFGVFGNARTRVGIGNMGMMKVRQADTLYIPNIDGSFDTIQGEDYYETDSWNEPAEFYSILPCVKVAHLFGDHIVLNVLIELCGILIPRPEDMEWWKPSLGLDFVYSFGKLSGAYVMDGTF